MVETSASMAWGRDAGEQIKASFVSANWFDESVTEPCTGACSATRSTRAPTCRRSCSRYTFWQTRLGADTNVVGTIAYIDRKPVTIAGVAPGSAARPRFQRARRLRADRAARIFYPESTMLRAWRRGHRRHVRPAAGWRVARRGARGAALDHAGDGRRTARGQERRMARAAAGPAQLHAAQRADTPSWPSSR